MHGGDAGRSGDARALIEPLLAAMPADCSTPDLDDARALLSRA